MTQEQRIAHLIPGKWSASDPSINDAPCGVRFVPMMKQVLP